MHSQPYDVESPGSTGALRVMDPNDGSLLTVPLIRTVTSNPQQPSTTTVEFVGNPPRTRAGRAGPGTQDYEIVRAPALRYYRVLQAAYDEPHNLTFYDYGDTPIATQTEATGLYYVTAAGVVTLEGLNAGTPDSPALQFLPGRVICASLAVDAEVLAIERVTSATGLQVSRYGKITSAATATEGGFATPDDEAITAVLEANKARFYVVQPGTVREMVGRVTMLGGYSRAPGNEGQVETIQITIHNRRDLLTVAPPTA